MAIYRNIHITFWSDAKIVDDFTPEDKYFMLYCLTNNCTNLCGCYEISKKQMARDLGYNEETIKNLLNRFSNIHKIIYYNEDNKEIFIKNWYKYNWTKSEKLDKPLLEEIKNIKTIDFKAFLADLYNKRDTVSIPYIYPMDTTVTDTVTVTVSDTVSDNKKAKKKKENEIDILINENFEDEELKETIYEFIKMRKAIKKPLTTRGLELMIKKLYKLTTNIDEQIEILNNSIMNNWQGIFPLKTETRNNKGGFDDFKELWEEARKEDEQARNNANNNTSSW